LVVFQKEEAYNFADKVLYRIIPYNTPHRGILRNSSV